MDLVVAIAMAAAAAAVHGSTSTDLRREPTIASLSRTSLQGSPGRWDTLSKSYVLTSCAASFWGSGFVYVFNSKRVERVGWLLLVAQRAPCPLKEVLKVNEYGNTSRNTSWWNRCMNKRCGRVFWFINTLWYGFMGVHFEQFVTVHGRKWIQNPFPR